MGLFAPTSYSGLCVGGVKTGETVTSTTEEIHFSHAIAGVEWADLYRWNGTTFVFVRTDQVFGIV